MTEDDTFNELTRAVPFAKFKHLYDTFFANGGKCFSDEYFDLFEDYDWEYDEFEVELKKRNLL